MPKYMYDCEECGEFCVKQEIVEDPINECPTCHRDVKRSIKGSTQGLIYGKDIEYMSDSDRDKFRKDPERAMKRRKALGL
jgi:putative FmdB family regulatory protein